MKSLFLWGILFYLFYRIYNFFSRISVALKNTEKSQQSTSQPTEEKKSYNKTDVIDVEYTEIKDDKRS